MTAGPARVASLVIPILLLAAAPPASAGGEEPIVCTLKNQEFCGNWWGSAAIGNMTIQDGIWRDPKRDFSYRCTVLEEFRRDGRPFSIFQCIYSSPRVTHPPTFVLLALLESNARVTMMFTSAKSRACLYISVEEVLTDRRVLANCITGQHYFIRPE